MSTVPFEVVTPDKLVLSCEVSMITLRGGDGEIGILPRHMALATTVKPGLVKVKFAEGEDFIAVSGGFLEVLPNRVTLLADTAELPANIDVARAKLAKERAEHRLVQHTDQNDVARAERALERAMIRIEAVDFSAKHGNVLATLARESKITV